MPAKPNILFIVLDTQRRDRLSLYDYERETSPNIDNFAQHATVFERAVAPAQWTVPAHGSLFTGLYPSTHQLTQAFEHLPDEYPTLAEILRDNDYHTVAFCNNPMVGILENGLRRGFDTFYNYTGATPNRPVDTTRHPVRRQLATMFRRIAHRASNQFAHSDALFKLSLNPFISPFWTRFINFKGSTPRSIDDLMAFWQHYHAGGTDKPLFLFANLMGVHLPYHPPRDYMQRVAPELVNDKQAYRFMAQFNGDAEAWISPDDPPLQDWQRQALNGFYNAEILHQDWHVGRLLAMLRNKGFLDDTLVIIAADHGEGHGDHGFLGHSFVVYHELVHVPLIIHYPERYPAKRITTNVSTRRIFHTILEAAGVESLGDDNNANGNIEALSLSRSLNGRPDSERGIAFAEAFPPQNLLKILQSRRPELVDNRQLTEIRRGIYEGDHKLAMVGNRVEELFNVANDPVETENIATQKPDLADDLRNRVQHFVTSAETQRTSAASNGAISEDVMDNLRALGYVE